MRELKRNLGIWRGYSIAVGLCLSFLVLFPGCGSRSGSGPRVPSISSGSEKLPGAVSHSKKPQVKRPLTWLELKALRGNAPQGGTLPAQLPEPKLSPPEAVKAHPSWLEMVKQGTAPDINNLATWKRLKQMKGEVPASPKSVNESTLQNRAQGSMNLVPYRSSGVAHTPRFAPREFPAEVWASLDRLPPPPPGLPSRMGMKKVSVLLPHSFPGGKAYDGDSGWIDSAYADTSDPNNALIQPPSNVPPDDLGFLMYRVSGITQDVGYLKLTSSSSGETYGVAAYNFNFGSLGRWEPLFWDVADNPNIALNVPGADFVSSAGDLTFVVFTYYPVEVTVQELEVSPSGGAPGYDEIEDNDDFTEANMFWSLDFTDWRGNVGDDPTDPYDGDDFDYYVFNSADPLGPGEILSVYMTLDSSTGDVNMELYDGNYSYITGSYGADNDEAFTIMLPDWSVPPYYLHVFTWSGYSDYFIDASHVPPTYDETENNDSTSEANEFPPLDFTDFSGNLGPDPTFPYDGDNDDYFTFNAGDGLGVGDTVTLYMSYNSASGNLDLELYDSDGDFLAGSYDADDDEQITYTFAAGDTAPYFVRAMAGSGYSDYFIDGLLGAPPTYDEIEDNDDPFQANELPSLGFADFSGNIGPDPSFPYDGDDWDVFTFNAGDGIGPGSSVELYLTSDSSTGDVNIEIYDSEYDLLVGSYDTDDDEIIQYYFYPDDLAPYYIVVFTWWGYSDYLLDGSVGPPPPPPYDEVEDNDDFSQATEFPALDFVDFSGNCGPDPTFPYDFDYSDYFTFNAGDGLGPGDAVTVYMTLDSTTGNLELELYDSEYDLLAWSYDTDDDETFTYTFGPGDVPPYYVLVYTWQGYSDYLVDASLSPPSYDETEDNDAPSQANEFPPLEFLDFSGNLGPDPTFPYDGDNDDYFTFNAGDALGVGDTVTVYMTLNAATGNLDLELYDSDGDLLAGSYEADDDEMVTYTFVAGDNAPYYVRAFAASGYSNYFIDGFLGAPPTYDETEDNDDFSQANELPSLGFADFSGNIGPDPSFPYDGDDWDVFTFNAGDGIGPGSSLVLYLTSDSSTGDVNIEIYDSEYDLLVGSYDTDDDEIIQYYFYPDDLAPYYIVVFTWWGYSDYLLDGNAVPPPPPYDEVEDNDDFSQATEFPALDFVDFSGNCGNDPTFPYDFDDTDFFTFNAGDGLGPGDTVTVYMTLDSTTGDLDLYLLDSDNDLLASSEDIDDDETFTYTFVSGDTPPYYVQVFAYQGYSDYLVDGSKS